MTPGRWRQIEDLYNAVCGRDVSERDVLLAKADPDLRAAVERLLDQPSSGSPLDSPAWEGTSSEAPPAPAIGARLGPYRIEARIGSGGMGDVYRAVDTRLQRTVAIKIPNEPLDRRFEREARHRRAESSSHLHRARHRSELPGDGTGGGSDARRAHLSGSDSRGGSAGHRAPDRRCLGSGARAGHYPSRSETGQCQNQGGRHGEGSRFRAGATGAER